MRAVFSLIVCIGISTFSWEVAVSPALAAPKKVAPSTPPGPACRSLFLLEPISGEALLNENAEVAQPPASMVKLMTTYVVMKRLKEGTINLDDLITVSATASKVGGSQVYLKEKEQFPLSDLLGAVLVQSANDAALAISEHVGGTREGFVEMMNEEAKKLGLEHSTFHSPHGLPPSEGQEADLMSASDLGKLGRSLMKEFPTVLEFTKISETPFRNGEFIMRNHNHLVRSFPGCDGLKTGYYDKAGFGVTATAERKGVRLIAVAMGCEQRKKRDEETARILSWGFSRFKTVPLAKKGTPSAVRVSVIGGKKSELIPVVAEDLSGVVRVGEEDKVVKKEEACGPIRAPVQANTSCGVVRYLIGDREIGRTPLVLTEDVAQGFMGKLKGYVGM